MRWKWILSIAAAVVIVGLIVICIIIASYDFNKLKPQITDLAKEYTGRDLTLAGDIKLGIGLSPDLKVENVSFQNAAWGSRPELAKIERLEVQVELLPLIRGDIQVKRLILLKPDILIENDKSGKSNLAFDVPAQKEPAPDNKEDKDAAPALFAFSKISIKDGKIMLHDHQSGSKHMIGLNQFDLQAPEFSAPADMVFEGIYNDIPIQASGNLGPLSGILDPVETWPFDLKIQTLESNIEIAGKIQDPTGIKGIDVKLSAAGSDLGNFGKITGEPLPVQGPYKFSGQLVAPDLKVIKLDNFSFVLGTDSIGGTAAVNLSSEKPEITANLNSDHLDLRPVLAQQEQKSSTTEKKPGKVFPATSLPLDGLNAANAAIDLEIKQLLLPKSAMNNLKTKVSLKNGHLMIKPLLADIGGGKLAVELNLKTNNKAATIDTKLKVDQLDLGSMLKENDIMIVDTPRMTIIGVGQIDLKTEKLDFGIKPQPKEGLGTKETGKLSISLKELTNLFRLSGTLSNPLLGISTEETLKSVAKTGFALLTGPVGMAKLFISGSSGSENPCATALKIAAKGPAASKETAGKKKDTKKSVEKKTKGIGNKILDVFKGKQ